MERWLLCRMFSFWWHMFDILGTIAFAVSGILVGVLRRMDVFGVFVLSAATAVGGGIIRDILIGRIPPTVFQSSLYFWLIIASIVVMGMVLRYSDLHLHYRWGKYWRRIYLLCDAIGLGAFTVTGILLGYFLYPDLWVLNMTLGVITAVGGGVVRDVLAGLIPGVLRREFYAMASLTGAGSFYVFLFCTDMNIGIAVIGSFGLTVGLRLLAIRFNWRVPRIMRHRPGQRV